MKKIFLFFFLAISWNSIACLNYIGVTVYGKATMNEMGPNSGHFLHGYNPSHRNERKDLLNDVAGLKLVLAGNPAHFSAKNDLAVDYIRLGSYTEALSLLLSNYAIEPDHYAVNANLGVLYELTGKNDSALYFTERAWRVNPGSHNGSEWIHLNILKVSLEENPDDALRNYQLTGLDFGSGAVPDTSTVSFSSHFRANRSLNNHRDSASLLVTQLEYQLMERTYFIKPRNKLVGELFFALGDMYSLFYDQYWALWAYTRALEYGTLHNTLVKKRGAYLYKRAKGARRPGAGQITSTKKDYDKVMAFWSSGE